jgi:peptide deformylase
VSGFTDRSTQKADLLFTPNEDHYVGTSAAGAVIQRYNSSGRVGITAPHIGVLRRVVVLHLPDGSGPRTYINPEIVSRSDEIARHEEGSISMPGITEVVERAAQVGVRYRDVDGHERMEDAEGLRAVCHQHEIDQLDGIFWMQRLSALRRKRLKAWYEKAGRNGTE